MLGKQDNENSCAHAEKRSCPLDEALDENLLGDALGLEVVEDGLLEFAVVVRAFEGMDDGFGGEAVF